jgi:hypothetical protein
MIYGSGMPQFADEYALSETDPAHIRAARKRSLFDKSEGGDEAKTSSPVAGHCAFKNHQRTDKPDKFSV